MTEHALVTRVLDKSEHLKWDEFVNSTRHGNIFSKYDWISLSSDSLKKEFGFFGTFEDDVLVAGCPIFHLKKYNIINYIGNVCGMMPYSGVIIENELDGSVRKKEQRMFKIMSSLIEGLLNIRSAGLVLRNPPELTDVRPFSWTGWNSKVHYTYLLDLMNLNYSTDVKRNIKNAIKENVEIVRSSDIKRYYSSFVKTFQHQGLTPPVHDHYISTLFDYIERNDLGEMWVARTDNDEWIAAEIFLFDDHLVHRWTAATDPVLRKNGGYHLLLDTVFKKFSDKGFKKVNLMAANTPQLTQFITGFNPTIVPYYSVNKFKFPVSTIIRS